MTETPYYRNTHINLGGFSVGELTRALDDSAAYFDGEADDSAKQSTLEKLVVAGKNILAPIRNQGFVVDVVRSFSENASNHGTGYTLDIAPASKNFEDCYAIATFLIDMQTCDQIWIEASDDSGNFHVHARANPDGFNDNPNLMTIYDVDATNTKDELEFKITTMKSVKEV